MGVPALMESMPTQRQQRRVQTCGESGSLAIKRKGSPCQQDDTGSHCLKGMKSGPSLPEDVIAHIHALMPLRDAARAACVSHAFLRSWRCYPNLTFSRESLGLYGYAGTKGERALYLVNKIDHILKSHSGVGIKTLHLELCQWYNVNTGYLDKWLTTAVTPGIQELILLLPFRKNSMTEYNLPCSLLSDGSGKSIQYISLTRCSFHPTAGLGCLTRLRLHSVHISNDELGCFLSQSLVLKHLELLYCDEIICLKIPCLLQQLRFLSVGKCKMLLAIESNAPNISTIHLGGDLVPILLGDGSLQVKELKISCSGYSDLACYALAKIPSIAPNLETLIISLPNERVNTPMVPGQFLCLKYLSISLDRTSPAYDYSSLFSFFDASPGLETFVLLLRAINTKLDMILGDLSYLTLTRECRHTNLKTVKIIGFCAVRSMIELTCHMLEKVTSLERLTLDTTEGFFRCPSSKAGKCLPRSRYALQAAHKAILAIRKYIKGKVPSTVDLEVVEPCSSCLSGANEL